jgi:hypothetical protein
VVDVTCRASVGVAVQYHRRRDCPSAITTYPTARGRALPTMPLEPGERQTRRPKAADVETVALFVPSSCHDPTSQARVADEYGLREPPHSYSNSSFRSAPQQRLATPRARSIPQRARWFRQECGPLSGPGSADYPRRRAPAFRSDRSPRAAARAASAPAGWLGWLDFPVRSSDRRLVQTRPIDDEWSHSGKHSLVGAGAIRP